MDVLVFMNFEARTGSMAIDLSSMQYLVIDDFADMRSMLRSMLVSYGVTKIDMAGTGKDAVKQLSKNHYDVVLCDYNLGDGKDGQQILEEARDKGYIKDSTAFLMLTAENTMEMVMGAVEYQPDDYLSKPFNKDMLRSRLEKVIIKKMELDAIVKLLNKEQYAEAIALCDEQIVKNPRSATDLLKIKADILMKLDRHDEAATIFESVLAKRDVPWAMMGLGKVRFHSEKYMEAKNIFQKVIDESNTQMEAYDWLVKTTLALGDQREALKILTQATEVSPKAILRQMELGNLAIKENDLEVAAKAFKKAVQVGCNSIYQTPSNYTKLAKIQGKGSGKDALATLSKLRGDFGKDDEANLHAAIAESLVLKGLGRENDAKKAFAEAGNLFGKAQNKISKDIAMEMANACIENGDKDKGVEILRDLVKNHHDDKALVMQVQGVFGAVGLAEEGQALINATIKEVVELNNTGTQLARDGKYDEAIRFFEKAVESMPDNGTINMNIANVMLMQMKANGKNDTQLYKVRQYLERVRKADPNNDKYRKLNAMYEKVLAS
jgi:CheY-like chemotaxis protein